MKKMNKTSAASLAAVRGLSLAACGSSASSSAAASSEAASGAAEGKTYRVAIVQQLFLAKFFPPKRSQARLMLENTIYRRSREANIKKMK